MLLPCAVCIAPEIEFPWKSSLLAWSLNSHSERSHVAHYCIYFSTCCLSFPSPFLPQAKNDFYASPPPSPHTYPDHHHHQHHTQDAALRLPRRQNRVVGGGERSHSRRLPKHHRGRRNLFLSSSFTTSGTDPHIVLRHRLGDCHHPLWLQVGGLHERLDPKNPQKTGESRRQARDYGR